MAIRALAYEEESLRAAAQRHLDDICRELNLAFEEVRRLEKEHVEAERELKAAIEAEFKG